MSDESKKAMRRLGAPMFKCPACGADFQVRRLPRFWIHRYVDGELSDSPTDETLLFCGRLCSESFAEEKRNEQTDEWDPEQKCNVTVSYVVHRETE